MDTRTQALLNGRIGATMIRLALPNVVIMVVQASIGLIETYFVARLGTDALAGMALVFPALMLIQTISAGAVGGGILSAVARALGSNRREDAERLAWHAVALAIALGIVTTAAAFLGGAALYSAMGGRGESLRVALAYSNIVFAGAVLLWIFNSLAAVIRGTGNMTVPASVTAVGALFLIPLSPALIFGIGPFPHLGVVGGAVSVVIYYALGSAYFAYFIWSGRGVIRPSLKLPRLKWTYAREILRVGAVSSLVSFSTNASIAAATGFAGAFGPAAVAGYGTGARLEYLLIPLVFGLGAPVVAMVGTAIGAGDRERARLVAWTAAGFAGILTEAIGLAAAVFPHAWLSLFGSDPTMLVTGTRYLRLVGPFYGFFGVGLVLYFAAQGAGYLRWPVVAAALRITITVGAGALVLHEGYGIDGVFWALGLALVAMGLTNVSALAAGRLLGAPLTGAALAATPRKMRYHPAS